MIEETLKKLVNQLTETSYEEDKMDLLNEIYKKSLEDPLSVGTFCIKSVFNTLFEMEDQYFQYKILEILFNTQYKEEFVEILAEDSSSLDRIFELSLAEGLYFCNLFKCEKFVEFTRKSHKSVDFLTKVLKKQKFKEISFLIKENADKLVKNGIFKGEKLERSAIILLIKNSLENQKVFVEEKMYLMYENEMEVLEILLNPKIGNLKKLQNQILSPKLIHKAVDSKNYKFIWNLVRGNGNSLKFALKFLSAEELSEAADALNSSAADILDLWMGIDESCVDVISNGFLVCILLNIRQIQKNLDFSIIKSGLINKPEITLCYLIFIPPEIDLDLTSFLNPEIDRKILFYLSLFLSLIQKYSVDFSLIQIIEYLNDFKAFLSAGKTFSTKIDEMLMSSLEDFIKYYNEYVYEQTLEEFAKERGLPIKEGTIEKEEKTQSKDVENVEREESMINIDNFERLNKGIQSVLRFFRKNDDN